jgi:lysophospholipase L1-like esterase
MSTRRATVAGVVILSVFGIVLGLATFSLIERYFFGGSIRGTRAVTALSWHILGRAPTRDELAHGLALWRESPDALMDAAKPGRNQNATPQDNQDYGLSFVDQNGRVLSARTGPLKLVLDPFTIYAHWPNQRTGPFNIDDRGFRVTPRRAAKPRMVVLGGSTAFGYLMPSDAHAFPSLLAERFSDFEVINAAVVGYLSGQELASMVHRLDQLRPAIYIVFDGWNELFDQGLLLHRPPNLFGFNHEFFEIQNRLASYHSLTGGTQARLDPGGIAKPVEPEGAYLNAIHDSYAHNLNLMRAFATARGAKFLVVFQPELGNKPHRSPAEVKSLTKSNEMHKYLDRKFPAKYARMIRSAREFCEREGIPFVDAQREPELRDTAETLFYDPPHLNERGHVLIADILERRLRRMLADAPVASAGAGPR